VLRSAGFALLFSTMPLAAVTSPGADRAEHAFYDFGRSIGQVVSGFVGTPSHAPSRGSNEVEAAAAAQPEAAPGGVAPASKPSARSSNSNKKARHATQSPELVVTVGEQRILELARLRAVPEGRPVPAKGARPAGIALYGVSRLGVGLRDGDVLTAVEGRSVQAEGQVIGVVTSVLLRQVRRISGEFWRGDRRGVIVVDLPIVRLSLNDR
jgi:hypothetical protein